MMYNIARPHAKDVPMINFAEELDIHDNPFSFDKMFSEERLLFRQHIDNRQ